MYSILLLNLIHNHTDKEQIMHYRYILIITYILLIIGCGKFEHQFTKIVSSDEVVVTNVFCSTLIGIPIFCTIVEDRTVTVYVETIVTQIVETIVEEEVRKEVIIEKIVIEIETIYVTNETDINEIVIEVIERVKELVPEEDLIDVPLDEIVEEVTNEFIEQL